MGRETSSLDCSSGTYQMVIVTAYPERQPSGTMQFHADGVALEKDYSAICLMGILKEPSGTEHASVFDVFGNYVRADSAPPMARVAVVL